MLESITIKLIIETFLIVAAVATVGVLAYLTASVVRNYIREHRTKHSVNAKTIVMIEKLNNGNSCVAVGFLEGNTKMVDNKVWQAEKLDKELQKFPVNQPVVIES